MTHQSPSGRPHHRSRHAAATRSSTRLRQRARRNVRLLIAAVSAVAGICLVVGSVGLVAKITALPAGTHLSAAAHQRPASAVEAGHAPPSASRARLPGPAQARPSHDRGHARRSRPTLDPLRLRLPLRLDDVVGSRLLVEDRIPGAAPLELEETVGASDEQEAVP
jgi:hypothetical protein